MPRTSLSLTRTANSAPISLSPMSISNSYSGSLFSMSTQVFNPAPVWIVIFSFACSGPRSEQRYAATQRVPLPEISASEPSALISRISTSAVAWGYIHSTPSAPTPSWRLQICCVNAAMSEEASARSACDKSIKRKSFPQALAFTNGIPGVFVLTPIPLGPAKMHSPAQSTPSVLPAIFAGHGCNQARQIGLAYVDQYFRSQHFASCDVDAPRCG